jgi:hypothetical protein
VELDNVRVLHALQHLQLIVDHLLVSADVLLQDDLDSDLALGAVGLADDTVCAGSQRLSEAVSRPAGEVSALPLYARGTEQRTCGHSCRAGRAAC